MTDDGGQAHIKGFSQIHRAPYNFRSRRPFVDYIIVRFPFDFHPYRPRERYVKGRKNENKVKHVS